MAGNHEQDGSLIKIIIYAVGVLAGVGAKLAMMHRKKPINMRDVIVNSVIAFASAFFVYSLLVYTGNTQLATVSSVICGRFAEDVLRFGFLTTKKMLRIVADETEKTDQS